MLRGITSPSVIRSELEACQAERDFFKEKYTENTAIIEQLNTKLKDSQRVIDKLRSQILDLELEKSRLTGANSDAGGDSSKDTSITCTSSEDVVVEDKNSTISVEENKLNTIVDNDDNFNNTPSKTSTQETVALDNSGDSSVDVGGTAHTDKCIEEDNGDNEKDVDNNDDEEQEDEEDDDDIDNIRANAERMLLWANYQTSKRSNSTPKFDNEEEDESKSQTSTKLGNKIPVRRVMSTPIQTTLEDKRQSSLSDDDESTLGSRHQPSVGSESKIGSGRKLFNRIADMIDGSPSDSESEEDDDSDEESADSSFADDREEVLMYNSEM